MRTCDVWKNCSDAEFDNAMEGMEKLVMNRLYDLSVLFLIFFLRDGHSNDIFPLGIQVHSLPSYLMLLHQGP